MNVQRMSHSATLLHDGRVLAVGGTGTSGNLDSSEIFDPSTGVWTMAGTLARRRAGHTATLLQDGRVLVVGGDGVTTEIYNPATGRWTFSDP